MPHTQFTPAMTDPRDVEIESPTSPLIITWEDGHKSTYELEFLRRMCPCAQCTEHGQTSLHERMHRPLPERSFEVRSLNPVGNYAVSIVWGDGHNTGIYSFQHLREICACPSCVPQETYDV